METDAMAAQVGTATAQTASDGRRWTLRPARPTDSRGLARLFSDVRREGRWLVTPPSAVSQPSEAFFIGEMIRGEEGLALVAEADGEAIGNVLISIERNVVSSHVGTLSIVVAEGWRDVGIGSAMVRAAQDWSAANGLRKVALAVFPDNERAIAVYERAGFVREGLRRKQYRGEGGELRDELLMAWFPDGQDAP
ncbi:MAG TPA: GNAT family protein [Candidatus Limnocylindria bacterium]|nr:GNAT family protein [Candidatus Limnocylindria bacterium]